MAIGEFTRYGLVFASSLTGAVAGYFYSNRAINLRMKFEKRGKRVLRSSDPLWMYTRIIKQKKEKLEEVKKLGELKELTETTTNGLTEEDKAFKLMQWCETKLIDSKWKTNLENFVSELCEYPNF